MGKVPQHPPTMERPMLRSWQASSAMSSGAASQWISPSAIFGAPGFGWRMVGLNFGIPTWRGDLVDFTECPAFGDTRSESGWVVPDFQIRFSTPLRRKSQITKRLWMWPTQYPSRNRHGPSTCCGEFSFVVRHRPFLLGPRIACCAAGLQPRSRAKAARANRWWRVMLFWSRCTSRIQCARKGAGNLNFLLPALIRRVPNFKPFRDCTHESGFFRRALIPGPHHDPRRLPYFPFIWPCHAGSGH